MRILYACLGNPFTEDMLYQENYYLQAYQEGGDEVLVLADPRKHVKTDIVEVGACEYNFSEKILVRRIVYDKIINKFVSYKVRKYGAFYKTVTDFKPDVMMINSLQMWNLLELRRIKKELPQIRIYGSTSATFYNTAKNGLSKYILHGVFYKKWLRKSIDCFEKIYYAVPECLEFYSKMYGISVDKFDFRPLPTKIIEEQEKMEIRKMVRQKYNIDENTLLFVHSGKMNKEKKTIEVIQSIKRVSDADVKLVLAGAFFEDIESQVRELIDGDTNIKYVGMLSGQELTQLLCACDMYLQPGSPSQTAQTAIGVGCPVVLPQMESYLPFMEGNGIWANNEEELNNAVQMVVNKPEILNEMGKKAYLMAYKKLDYRKLAYIFNDY